MPEAIWPSENDNVEYSTVYRATKSVELLKVDDFLPWNIEHKNQMKRFRNLFEQHNYGLSVFTDLKTLKKTVNRYPALKETTASFSIGFTSLKRGVSLKEDDNHHVEYFLFDYINNSPKDDFEIIEVL